MRPAAEIVRVEGAECRLTCVFCGLRASFWKAFSVFAKVSWKTLVLEVFSFWEILVENARFGSLPSQGVINVCAVGRLRQCLRQFFLARCAMGGCERSKLRLRGFTFARCAAGRLRERLHGFFLGAAASGRKIRSLAFLHRAGSSACPPRLHPCPPLWG